MDIYLNWRVADQKKNQYSQEELKKKFRGSRADRVFSAIMGKDLMSYVGAINTIFTPPKSEGIFFVFAENKQIEFANLIDPSRGSGKIGPTTFLKPRHSPLVPDSPKGSNPAQMWRNMASLKGIGASYRQAGIGSSLHIAFNKTTCDVHVDRAGFIRKDAMGRVTWDHNGMLRHLMIDLASDYRDEIALPLVSMGINDNNHNPILSATIAPWLAVDLPSRENENKGSISFGLGVSGTF